MRRWVDPLLAFAAALALFALLRQEVFYHIDARLHIIAAERDQVFNSRHLLYIPMLRGLHDLLRPWEVEWFAIASWLSVVGSALGVGLLHGATQVLGVGRRAAWLVTAVFATNPAVLFYASVAELHGPFLPGAGLAALAFAALVRRPHPGWALAMGVGVGVWYLLHATGLLLLVALPLLYVGFARPTARPWAALGHAAKAVAWSAPPAFAVGFGAPLLLRALGADAGAGRAVSFLLGDPATLLERGANTPALLWREWLWSCAPACVAWLGAFGAARWRWAAWAMAASVLVYAMFTAVLLPGDASERGAYLLPLVWPAALLATATLRARWVLLVAALGAAFGVAQIADHEQPAPARAFAAGVRQAAGAQPTLLLIGTSDELDYCFSHLAASAVWPGSVAWGAAPTGATGARTRYLFLPEILVLAKRPADMQAGSQLLLGLLQLALRNGEVVLLSAGGEAALRDGTGLGDPEFGAKLLRDLRAALRVTEVTGPGFAAIQLSLR